MTPGAGKREAAWVSRRGEGEGDGRLSLLFFPRVKRCTRCGLVVLRYCTRRVSDQEFQPQVQWDGTWRDWIGGRTSTPHQPKAESAASVAPRGVPRAAVARP